MMKYKTGKVIGIIAAILIVAFVLIIVFISPIAKYMVEKYSPKYLGRQVRVSWIYLNPFTGYIHLDHPKIYEQKSDSIFFQAEGINASFAMTKMFRKTYEISSLTINKPWIRIIQNHNQFNFSDVIVKFSPDTTAPPKPSSEPLHFNLLDMAINEGEFHYIEQTIGVNYFIKEVKFRSPGLRWNVDSISGILSFLSGPAKGDIRTNFMINLKDLDYRIAAIVNHFELDIIDQYLKDLANYGSYSANLDADVKATGNLRDQLNLIASGTVGVNDFHFGKVRGQDFVSFDTLLLSAKEINPKNYKYIIDSLALRHPFFKYERYDHLDNLQTMFGEGGSNYTAAKADSTKFNLIVTIAEFVKTLARNFLQSYYKVGRVAIYRGDVTFDDYAIREKFSISANPLNIAANAVDKNNKRVLFTLASGMKPFGNVGLNLSIDPADFNQFDLSYSMQHLSAPSFNPYIITYTSFPLDRGTLEVNGQWHVTDGQIRSDNHLLVLDPRTSKRLHHKDTKWIPVPLIMSIVRTPGNVIDFDIPIEGNLKNPKFKLRDAILEVLKNIFVKPPSVGYLVHVKAKETQVEKLLIVKWPMRSDKLKQEQDKFLTRVADFLKKNNDTTITIIPEEFALKEKEYTLFYEAKKKYFSLHHKLEGAGLTEKDSLEIEKMSVKDSMFMKYLDSYVDSKKHLYFTIQDKCKAYVGDAAVNTSYARLIKERKEVVLRFFQQKGVESRVKIDAPLGLIPLDGFSYFKIDYKGTVPDDLVKAYEEMNDLDEKNPRGKYKNERKKEGGVLPENQEALKSLKPSSVK